MIPNDLIQRSIIHFRELWGIAASPSPPPGRRSFRTYRTLLLHPFRQSIPYSRRPRRQRMSLYVQIWTYFPIETQCRFLLCICPHHKLKCYYYFRTIRRWGRGEGGTTELSTHPTPPTLPHPMIEVEMKIMCNSGDENGTDEEE